MRYMIPVLILTVVLSVIGFLAMCAYVQVHDPSQIPAVTKGELEQAKVSWKKSEECIECHF